MKKTAPKNNYLSCEAQAKALAAAISEAGFDADYVGVNENEWAVVRHNMNRNAVNSIYRKLNVAECGKCETYTCKQAAKKRSRPAKKGAK